MPFVDTDIHNLETQLFNSDFNFQYGSPQSGTFDSQGWNPGGQASRVPEEADSPSHAAEDLAVPFFYTATWKLQLRKGRLMTLTENTIEDLTVAPISHWNDSLRAEILDIVGERLPEPRYQSAETKVTVSTSKRAQRDFIKRFTALNIDWDLLADKLQSWSEEGSNLTVDFAFIYKEVEVDSTNKVGKAGRGATKRHLAARDRHIAEQEAAGLRPVWRDVYQVFECSSAACPNKGFSCWRDSNTQKHYKLDSDTLDRLVDFAEEGGRLENHADVPERIRDVIYRHEEEEMTRKRLKHKAPDPTAIHVYCHGHQEGGPGGSGENPQTSTRRAAPAGLKFPVPIDKAPPVYTAWLCKQVTDEDWRKGYKLALKIAMRKGCHLGRMYAAQSTYVKLLIANKVDEGIADQYVSRVEEWLEDIAT